MTVKVWLTVSYMWLTITTLANGQDYPRAPGTFFGPDPQVTNPQNIPNSNTYFPPSYNIHQAMDLSSLLSPGLAPFPMNQPTSFGPQNAAPYNPTFPPQWPDRSFSHPRQTSPFNNGPQGPSSVSPNQHPRDSFITRPQQTSPIFHQMTSQIMNPSNLRHQSPNPNFPVRQKTNPDFPSTQQIPQYLRGPQQTNTYSTGPQQRNFGPLTVPEQINHDYTSPQHIPQYLRGPQQTNSYSTGPQQRNFVPPTVPEQFNPDYTSQQQIPQDPTSLQQTNTDSAGPQQSNSVPATAPQLTDSGPTVPRSTDSGSTVPQKTDSYPADSQTTNPASDDSQPITSESESSSSVSKTPQDTSSKPSVPQHPSHGPHSHRPHPEKEIHSHPSGDPLGGLRILCIFNNRHFYKNGFTPAQLDPHLCTHLNYEFAILDPTTYEMMTGEPDLDIKLRFYEEAVGLKKVNPNLKVMMSLGGWGDSTKKYSEMADDPAKRKNFIEKCIPFLEKHGFDGMDLAWEYPNCWQGAIGVSPKDKQNFVVLLSEIKEEFEKHGLLLSVSVGAIKREVDAAYDVPGVSKNVHYINVMTYDMHGPWERKTSHHVQFEAMPGDKDKYCNVKGGMQVWIEKGADKKKLNMGLAFYGRTYRMNDPKQCGMGLPADVAGDPGPITKEGGILSFHEICNFLNSGNWTEKEDKHAGFYACSGDQFVCYDNPIMMVRKTRYCVDSGWGGVLVKDLSGDDSKGECFNMPFPLLKMVKLEMMHRVRQINS